jgi:hypothetical protein
MPDGILITSSGVSAGITDAIDVSATNITNALNVGDNIILGTTAVVNFEDFDVDADGAVALTGDGGTTMLTLTPSIAETADIVSISAIAGDGIVTDNVDGIFVQIEGANGTANDVSGVHVDFDPISASGDETFIGVLVDGITPGSAAETGISIGAGWDTGMAISQNATGKGITVTATAG